MERLESEQPCPHERHRRHQRRRYLLLACSCFSLYSSRFQRGLELVNRDVFLLLSICCVAGVASEPPLYLYPGRRESHPEGKKPLLDKTIAVDAQHDAECQHSSAFHFIASWAGWFAPPAQRKDFYSKSVPSPRLVNRLSLSPSQSSCAL